MNRLYLECGHWHCVDCAAKNLINGSVTDLLRSQAFYTEGFRGNTGRLRLLKHFVELLIFLFRHRLFLICSMYQIPMKALLRIRYEEYDHDHSTPADASTAIALPAAENDCGEDDDTGSTATVVGDDKNTSDDSMDCGDGDVLATPIRPDVYSPIVAAVTGDNRLLFTQTVATIREPTQTG